MAVYTATAVSVIADVDYGEGWITFQWPDPLYGHEGLTIDLDGHCSREMPIHSGQGPPEFVALERDSVKLRFPPALAQKLQLESDVEILFNIPDKDFTTLQLVIDYFSGR
jgi:hypothetical protein